MLHVFCDWEKIVCNREKNQCFPFGQKSVKLKSVEPEWGLSFRAWRQLPKCTLKDTRSQLRYVSFLVLVFRVLLALKFSLEWSHCQLFYVLTLLWPCAQIGVQKKAGSVLFKSVETWAGWSAKVEMKTALQTGQKKNETNTCAAVRNKDTMRVWSLPGGLLWSLYSCFGGQG